MKAGDKLMLVEAMKTFNEIVAHRAGKVTQIMVEDGVAGGVRPGADGHRMRL